MAESDQADSPVKKIQSKVTDTVSKLVGRWLPKFPAPKSTDNSETSKPPSIYGDLSESLLQVDTFPTEPESAPSPDQGPVYESVGSKMREQLVHFDKAVSNRLGLDQSLKSVGMEFVKAYFKAEVNHQRLDPDQAKELLKPATDRQLRASSSGPSITFTFPSPDTRVTYTLGDSTDLTEQDVESKTSLAYRKPEQALDISIKERKDGPPEVLFRKTNYHTDKETSFLAEVFKDPTTVSDDPFQPLKITFEVNREKVIVGDYSKMESSGDVHLSRIEVRNPDDPLEWWYGKFDERTNTIEWTKHTKGGKHLSLAGPVNVLHSTEVPGTMALFSGDKELGQIPIKPNLLEYVPIDIGSSATAHESSTSEPIAAGVA